MLAETTVVENRMEFLRLNVEAFRCARAAASCVVGPAWLHSDRLQPHSHSMSNWLLGHGSDALCDADSVAGPPVVAMDLSPDGSHWPSSPPKNCLFTRWMQILFGNCGILCCRHLMNVAFSSNERLLVSKTTRSSGFESIAFVWNVNTGR